MHATTTFTSSDGDGYELQMGRWSRRLAPPFIEFAGVAAAERVLDVGCGTGSLSFCLAENPHIARITGLDLSPSYVEHAKRANRNPRMDFQVGNACSLPFADASFDHALSMLVLQFIPEPDRAVREMRRVTLIFDTAALLDRNGEALRAKAYGRPLCRSGELAHVWRNAGLVDVTQDMRTIRMDFTSFTDFWRPAEGKEGPAAAYVGTLDAGAKSKLRDAVERMYLNGEPDGARSYAATAWVVKGRAP